MNLVFVINKNKSKMKKKFGKKNKGFTLLEVLIVVAIIGVIVTLTAMNISKSKIRKKTESVATQIQQGIVKAHDYAITGEVVAAELPNSFRFEFEVANNNFVIKGLDKDGNTLGNAFESDSLFVGTDNITITFEGGGGSQYIEYSVPHGILDAASADKVKICGGDQCDVNDNEYIITIKDSNVDLN